MSRKRHEKSIRLTKQEIEQICEEAAQKAAAKYTKEKSAAIKREHSKLLYNTKKLLENYTKLKDYVENAVSSVDEVKENDFINPEELLGFRILDSDQMLNSMIRGINRTKLMLAHIDRMLEVYRADCQRSSSTVKQRRWEIIRMMYLDRDDQKSTKQIAEYYNMEISGIQKEAKAARRDLTALFFGLDAMFIDSMNDNEI